MLVVAPLVVLSWKMLYPNSNLLLKKGIPGGKTFVVAAGVVGLATAAGFVAHDSNTRFRGAKQKLNEVRASTQAALDAHIAASQRSN